MEKKNLRMTEAMEYLGISRSTLTKLVHYRQIPYYQPREKGIIYFAVEDLDAWARSRRIAPISELEDKAAVHMARR